MEVYVISLLACQSIVVCGALSLTASMPSCCSGHCLLGYEAGRYSLNLSPIVKIKSQRNSSAGLPL